LSYNWTLPEIFMACDDKFKSKYCFSIIPRTRPDLKQMWDYQLESPTSSFRLKMLCTIATKTGRIILTDDLLTITESGNKATTVVENKDEFKSNLLKYFNMKL
jgi:N-hydroxyarylamine O-acetyltransferase